MGKIRSKPASPEFLENWGNIDWSDSKPEQSDTGEDDTKKPVSQIIPIISDKV